MAFYPSEYPPKFEQTQVITDFCEAIDASVETITCTVRENAGPHNFPCSMINSTFSRGYLERCVRPHYPPIANPTVVDFIPDGESIGKFNVSNVWKCLGLSLIPFGAIIIILAFLFLLFAV